MGGWLGRLFRGWRPYATSEHTDISGSTFLDEPLEREADFVNKPDQSAVVVDKPDQSALVTSPNSPIQLPSATASIRSTLLDDTFDEEYYINSPADIQLCVRGTVARVRPGSEPIANRLMSSEIETTFILVEPSDSQADPTPPESDVCKSEVVAKDDGAQSSEYPIKIETLEEMFPTRIREKKELIREREMKKKEMEENKAEDIHEKHAEHLLDTYRDVTAVDVGYREKGGIVQKGGPTCLLVWVKKKLPKSQVLPDQLLPKEIEGVPVDVLEGEVVYTMNSPRSGQNTLRKNNITKLVHTASVSRQLWGGDCLTPYLKPSHGTLGYFAEDSNKQIGVISAGHVMQHNKETRLLVPSKTHAYNNTTSNHDVKDQIATVVKTSSDNDDVDCGFALLNVCVPEYKLKNNTAVRGVVKSGDSVKEEVVFFYGSTSKKSSGTVLSDKLMCDIEDQDTKQKRRFRNQLRLSQPSLCGDSGAVVVKQEDHKAVGLLFANFIGHAVASPISKVEDFLEVNLITAD